MSEKTVDSVVCEKLEPISNPEGFAKQSTYWVWAGPEWGLTPEGRFLIGSVVRER